MTAQYIEDGLLIIFADDIWEVWCGADGESIINAHLVGSNPSREVAIAEAREELLELADRLSKHLPLPVQDDAFELQLREDAEHLFGALCEGDGEHSEDLDMGLILAAFRHLLTWAGVPKPAASRPTPEWNVDDVEAEIQKPGYSIIRGWLAIHGGASARIVLEEMCQLVRAALRVPSAPDGK